MNEKKLLEIIQQAEYEGDTQTLREAKQLLDQMRSKQKQSMSVGQKIGRGIQDAALGVEQNAGLAALQGTSLGWGDEALAGVLAAYGTFMPELAGGLPDNQSLKQNYDSIRQMIGERTAKYKNENPVEAGLAEAGGALLTGGAGLSRFGAKKGSDVLDRLMRNAGIGATEGAIYGAGAAEDGERMAGAGEGAMWGAGGGAVGGELLNKARKFFDDKSELQQHILQKIEAGSEDIDTAFYRVIREAVDDPTPPVNTNVPVLTAPDDVAEEILERARPVGTPVLARDRRQVNAARQGVSKSMLPVIRNANEATKKKLLDMNKLLARSLVNARDAASNRYTDVVGNSALERFRAIRGINREAGTRLDHAAEDLRHFMVSDALDPAINEFLMDLKGMGVRLGNSPQEFLQKIKRAQVNERKRDLFTGSLFEGIPEAEGVVDAIFKRMLSDGRGMNAWDAHVLKKFLDTRVNFGADGSKVADIPPLDHAIKRLRHNIDAALDSNFDNYRLANEDYAKTVSVLNEFKRLMPKNVDLLDPSKAGTSAVGTQLRTVLSNNRNRGSTTDVLAQMDNVAREYNVKFEDDLLTQILYADELERITGSQARTGLAGEVGKSLKDVNRYMRQSPSSAFADYVTTKADSKIFGEISDENLIRALDELLKAD